MSFTDKLVLWLHIGFAIFTIGPVTVAIMSTPRYIRKRNLVVVRYQYRTTMIFLIACLGVLIFGLVLAQLKHDFAKPWLIVSLTLFVVAFALLLLILRDQHRAIVALDDAEAIAEEAAMTAGPAEAADQPDAGAANGASEPAQPPGSPPPVDRHVAHVERGRIASLGGVVGVIWLVILVLMVWNG
jgi:Ca2+/Na+ antiporter